MGDHMISVSVYGDERCISAGYGWCVADLKRLVAAEWGLSEEGFELTAGGDPLDPTDRLSEVLEGDGSHATAIPSKAAVIRSARELLFQQNHIRNTDDTLELHAVMRNVCSSRSSSSSDPPGPSLELLLEAGADPTHQEAVFSLCDAGDCSSIGTLITAGAGVDKLFSLACQRGSLQVAQFLHAKGVVDVNKRDDRSLPPVFHAATSENCSLLRTVLEWGASVDVTIGSLSQTPFLQACIGGRHELIDLFHNKGADVNSQTVQGLCSLHYAIARDDAVLTEKLIAWGASVDLPDNRGSTAFFIAARRGAVPMMSLLRDWGADIDAVACDIRVTSLLLACRDGCRFEVAELLLKWGANINAVAAEHNQTCLHYAAGRGDLPTLKLLLRHGAELNMPDDLGNTPVLRAAINGKPEAVRLLAQRGADTDAANAKGERVTDLLPDIVLPGEAAVPQRRRGKPSGYRGAAAVMSHG